MGLFDRSRKFAAVFLCRSYVEEVGSHGRGGGPRVSTAVDAHWYGKNEPSSIFVYTGSPGQYPQAHISLCDTCLVLGETVSWPKVSHNIENHRLQKWFLWRKHVQAVTVSCTASLDTTSPAQRLQAYLFCSFRVLCAERASVDRMFPATMQISFSPINSAASIRSIFSYWYYSRHASTYYLASVSSVRWRQHILVECRRMWRLVVESFN